MLKNWKIFAKTKIMRIVNEILLKIWEKLKKQQFFKFLNLENKLVEN